MDMFSAKKMSFWLFLHSGLHASSLASQLGHGASVDLSSHQGSQAAESRAVGRRALRMFGGTGARGDRGVSGTRACLAVFRFQAKRSVQTDLALSVASLKPCLTFIVSFVAHGCAGRMFDPRSQMSQWKLGLKVGNTSLVSSPFTPATPGLGSSWRGITLGSQSSWLLPPALPPRMRVRSLRPSGLRLLTHDSVYLRGTDPRVPNCLSSEPDSHLVNFVPCWASVEHLAECRVTGWFGGWSDAIRGLQPQQISQPWWSSTPLSLATAGGI